jgi:hypothetical protein
MSCSRIRGKPARAVARSNDCERTSGRSAIRSLERRPGRRPARAGQLAGGRSPGGACEPEAPRSSSFNCNDDHLTRHEANLTAPLQVSGGDQILVGWCRRNSSEDQLWYRNAASESHYTDTGPWPPGSIAGKVLNSPGHIAAYAYFTPGATVEIKRGGVMVDAKVHVRRGGVWVDPTSIKVRRGGSWHDSE